MKKLCHLLFYLVVIFLVAACSKEPRLKIACVGDSLTYGLGVEDVTKDSYPALLAQMMGDTCSVGNFGICERTMLNRADLPYIDEIAYKDALDFNANIVIIMLGSNDTKPTNWVYNDDYKKDMKTLVESFQKQPSQPKVYLSYPLRPYTELSGHLGINDSIIVNHIIPYINEVALECNVKVIDTHTPMSNTPHFFPDRLHPNKEGNLVLADIIYKAISKES